MNRFDNDLRHAARGKRTSAIIASLAIMVCGILLACYFMSFRSLSVTVQPETAQQIALIKVTEGMAFALSNRIYGVSDNMKLTVSAAKYQTANLMQIA